MSVTFSRSHGSTERSPTQRGTVSFQSQSVLLATCALARATFQSRTQSGVHLTTLSACDKSSAHDVTRKINDSKLSCSAKSYRFTRHNICGGERPYADREQELSGSISSASSAPADSTCVQFMRFHTYGLGFEIRLSRGFFSLFLRVLYFLSHSFLQYESRTK